MRKWFNIDEHDQPEKRRLLLTNPTRLFLPSTPERKEDVLKMTNGAASVNVLKEAKQALIMLSEVPNSVRCITTLAFGTLESFTKLVAEKHSRVIGIFTVRHSLQYEASKGVGNQKP